MTLITRLITNERTIVFADGIITYHLGGKVLIKPNLEKKLIILSNAIIGISGAFEFGKWLPQNGMRPLTGKREYNVYNVLLNYINEKKVKTFGRETIFSLGNHLKDSVNAAHSGDYFASRPKDTTLLVTILNETIQHFRVIIRKTHGPFTCEIFELPLDIKDYDFDINLYESINSYDFRELLDQVANEIYQTNLSEELINNMTDQNIMEFGTLLYEKFEIQYKNPTVGNLHMHADLRI